MKAVDEPCFVISKLTKTITSPTTVYRYNEPNDFLLAKLSNTIIDQLKDRLDVMRMNLVLMLCMTSGGYKVR